MGAARNTAQGKARIALATALGDIPGWFGPSSSESGSKDYTIQEQNQILWESQVAFAFEARFELEPRAGGNLSWNTSVDYRTQLKYSADSREIAALYKQAGQNLNQDLNALAKAQRIKADPGAVDYLMRTSPSMVT